MPSPWDIGETAIILCNVSLRNIFCATDYWIEEEILTLISVDGNSCTMNGEEMMSDDVKVMSSPPPSSPTSTDIVFIVEAKSCNRAMYTKKKIDVLVKSLEETLSAERFTGNR